MRKKNRGCARGSERVDASFLAHGSVFELPHASASEGVRSFSERLDAFESILGVAGFQEIELVDTTEWNGEPK